MAQSAKPLKTVLKSFLKALRIAPHILTTQFYNDDDLTFINKIKDNKNIINYDDYDIRFRLSQEEELDKKILINLSNLQYTEADKITFRYKERLSMIIFDNEKLGQIRLDLTIVKFSNSPDNLHYADKEFEIELEYSKGTEDISDKILTQLLNEAKHVKQVLENSNEIIKKDEKEEEELILDIYQDILKEINVGLIKV